MFQYLAHIICAAILGRDLLQLKCFDYSGSEENQNNVYYLILALSLQSKSSSLTLFGARAQGVTFISILQRHSVFRVRAGHGHSHVIRGGNGHHGVILPRGARHCHLRWLLGNKWWKQTTQSIKTSQQFHTELLKCDRSSGNEKQFSYKPYPISIFRQQEHCILWWPCTLRALLPSLTTSFPSSVCWVGIIQVERQCQTPLLCQPEQLLNYPGVCQGVFHESKIQFMSHCP